MSQYAYALVGLTAIVAALIGLLTFAVLRFLSAMRDMRGQLRDSQGERVFMAAALEDALARLRSEERAMAARAEASERLSDEIVSSMASGLMVVGLDSEVRMLNAAGRRLLNVEADDLPAKASELLAKAPSLWQLIAECLARARPISRRSIPMPPGSSPATHLGVTVSPLFGHDKELHGAIALFTDISDVVALEEQVRLKDGLARLGELTAGLAHELRNGLATVHGYCRLIDMSRVPEEYRPYVDGIREETDNLEEVTARFLAFARPVALKLGPISLQALALRVADDFRPAVASRGGTIEVTGEFPIVEGDEVLLRQALANLLQNAVEACESVASPPDIVIEGQVDQTRMLARLEVRDNGPGIGPEIASRVFQPFFTCKGHGTGLGLALVEKIAVSHGGRASVGRPVSGAAIRIDLPLPARSA